MSDRLVVDRSLVSQVEYRTSGANVHRIRGMLSAYVMGADAYNRSIEHADTARQRKQLAKIKSNHYKIERVFRAFVFTGDIAAAENDTNDNQD